MTPPVTQCATDCPGEGCGLDFSAKTAPGKCQKCLRLDSLDPSSDTYQKTRCCMGATALHGPMWALPPESVQSARQARSNAFAVRTNRILQPNALANMPPRNTVDLNTSALDQFRNVGHNDADCIKVFVEGRLGGTRKGAGKIDPSLGQTSRSYPPEMPMQDIIEEVLTGWNAAWVKKNPLPLQQANVELRFHGNQTVLPNTEHMAVLDFYQEHMSSGTHEAYFGNLPKHAKIMKGKVLAIELWIDLDEEKPSSGTKRKASNSAGRSNVTSAHTPGKRPRRSGAALESKFQLQPVGANQSQDKSTKLLLVFVDICIDSETCEVSFKWPNLDDDDLATKNAVIENTAFKSGRMKHCYKLSIGDDHYVAKRFYDIGQGEDQVTLADNKHYLQLEVTRAEQARWFLSNFRRDTDERNIQVYKDVEISRCRLAVEVIKDAQQPSPASGSLARFEEQPLQMREVVWMLEPLRSASVTRYSGTMEHPIPKGQLALTLSAFVHYAFQFSGDNSIIFADLQGSSGRLSNNKMGMILFDMMTHTPSGDNGIGDHGEAGIQKWRDQHDCNMFCKELELEVGDSDGDDD
ncbi:kinase-like domain-containing protein [Mycena pura]|uniref:Kinase-like domain-containing protein n=1 Tax=Mycena pura TaxID=153505 RepID=A0AAD6V0X4_9AGAR|nr:kinase-like domain-containing protein [Mycena pura]